MVAPARKFAQDRRGNVSILAAFGLIAVTGFAALGVDLGSIFADRRRLQAMTDLAAITAAYNLQKAKAGAAATLRTNNIPESALMSVETGAYTPTPLLGPDKRFNVSSGATANAARVTLQSQTPLFFGKLVTGADTFTINTTATAATTAMASFAIGSRLASLNAGLLNSILGSMLGTTLSLSVMDYQSLLNAKINALEFLKSLAVKANITAGTYTELLNTNASISNVLQAVLATQKSANGNTDATAALTALTQSTALLTAKTPIASLVDPGPYGGLQIGDTPRGGALVSIYDLVYAAAQIANGTQQIATNVNLNLPGIAGVSLRVAIGERPAGASRITIGTTGASVYTAQTRAMLNIQLLGTGPVSAVNLPVYVDIAAGLATLTGITCGYPDVSASNVTLGVKPGIVDAWIGQVSPSQMSNFASAPSAAAATLVNLGLVQVTGRAHATMTNPSARSVSFTYADIQAMTKKTVNTRSFTTSLVASLIGDLELKVVVIGLGIPLQGLAGIVSGIISGATPAIDSLLVSVLATLGVGLGEADVWATGIRCDGAVLVN